MSSTVRIDLAPKAGFCIKSSSLTPAVLPPPPSHNSNLLESTPDPIPVPKGLKVFINIAWDPHVPPPPEGNEDSIRRAMQGEYVDEKDSSAWYVPVIVSNAKQDMDKSGNPSIVFDCIYNPTVKSRTLCDPNFKLFIVELALQRIESQTRLTLSRDIGTPNIASKGKLFPRSVHLPASAMAAFVGAATTSVPAPTTAPDMGIGKATLGANVKTPLIQEISDTNRTEIDDITTFTEPKSRTKSSNSLPGLRGIMKRSSSVISKPPPQNINPNLPLDWSWTKEDSGRLRIEVYVPGLTRTFVQSSSLDMEPRRLTLSIPSRRTLDIDLALSDAEIVSRISSSINAAVPQRPLSDSQETRKDQETSRTLQLKRQRDFDVDGAEAEWKVGSEVVVISL